MNFNRGMILFFSIFILFTSLIYGLETKISMEIWNRWTVGFQDSITENYMSVERGYFRIEPKFNDYIKGRFNIDVYSSDKSNDANGAGIKLKYAYLDFKNIVDYHTFSIGLIKNYFGTIYTWDYTTIEKSLVDIEKVTSSTDCGFSITGKFDYFIYNVGIYNGEGYKKTEDDLNTQPAFLANIRIKPIDNIMIGGSARYHNYGILDSINDQYRSKLAFAGVANINFKPVDLLIEFIVDKNNDPNIDTTITAQGFMVMPVLNFKEIAGKDIQLIGRYDMWDPNTDEDDDGHSRIIAGLNWNVFKDNSNKVMLQLNFERKMFEAEGSEPDDQIRLQFRWKFNTSV